MGVSTCSVCGQEVRRRLQQPPGQQQQQSTTVGKPPPQQLPRAVQPLPPQPQPQLQPEPQQQPQQEQQQEPSQPQPQQEQQQEPPQQRGSGLQQEQPRRAEDDMPSSQGNKHGQPAPLRNEEQSASQPVAAEQTPAEETPGEAFSKLEAQAALAAMAQEQAAEQIEQEQAVQQQDGQDAEQREEAWQPAAMAWMAVQQSWGLQPRHAKEAGEAEQPAALLPAAPAAENGNGTDQAGEPGDSDSGGHAAGTPGVVADEEPPRKRRRLSWSDNLQQVKVIDRAPRPQLRKVYSWHRLARSWKAASFRLG